ncbi:MAG: C39 family peptidase [Clostridia bacterium]|nr:C39 family peptidase [Clostridia bacterium]
MMDELGFSDEEKNWANLMYSSLNEQYLDPDSEYGDAGGLPSYDGVTLGESGETQVVYYNQLDERWSHQMYGKSSTIGAAGCGPTSLAIAVSTLTGKSIDPPAVCAWSVANGHRCEGNGSYHSLIPEGAKHYGLKVEKLGRSSAKELEKHLSSGHLVIAIMAKGHFTSSGHFIVLRGITKSGKVLVADPASYKRSGQEWDISIILNEARGDAAAGGPFWAVSK